MTSHHQGLGERIKMIRIKKGMTLEEFGKLILNANKSVVSKWENNLTVPNNERLLKIAEIGQVTVEYLVTGNPIDLPREKEINLKKQNTSLLLHEWKSLYYPDIKEFLEKQEVYYDKKRLNKEDKAIAINVLDYLFKDLTSNYPSDDKIEDEFKRMKKQSEILKQIKNNNNHAVKE